MSSQEQVEKLVLEIKEVFALDELESKIYLSLLRSGPITASALSKNLDLDRAGTYRTVEKMLSKNIISSTLSSPKILTPIEPKKVLRQTLEKKQTEIKKIHQSTPNLIDQINSKIAKSPESSLPTLKIIQGRENIYTEISQMIESCTETAFIATTAEDLKNMAATIIPEKIYNCKKNGGKVCLLVDGDENQIMHVSKSFAGSEIRMCSLPSEGRIAVLKNSKMIMSDSTQSSKPTPDYSVSTNACDMIDNIDKLCRLIWKSAKPMC